MSYLVWVLVFTTHINSGSVIQISGDYASYEDCNRVQQVVKAQNANLESVPVCVQVRKIK